MQKYCPYFGNSQKESKGGFTLIELILVMTVVGTLAALVIAQYPATQKRARDTQRKSDIKQYQSALEVYANANSGQYPNTSGTLPSVCNSNLTNFTSDCPNAPDGAAKYEYRGSTLEYVVWAPLEVPDGSGNTQYFIACSNGLTDIDTAAPGGSTCPL